LKPLANTLLCEKVPEQSGTDRIFVILNEESKMKKFFSFVVIAAMCVSMVGCGGEAAKDKDKKPTDPAPPTTPADPAAKPADPAPPK
jgi:hypothetical protein